MDEHPRRAAAARAPLPARGGRPLVLALLLAGCGGAPAVPDSPQLVPGPSPFEYPLSLWDANVEGTTELMVHVSAAGSVDSVYVERGSGYPAFDSAAVAGARSLRFSPGRSGPDAVATWTRVPVRFSRDSASVTLMPRGGQEGP